MLKLGTVLEAICDTRYCRKGNTYRVNRLDEATFGVNYEGTKTALFEHDELPYYFKVISDLVCPTCLKAFKAIQEEECINCSKE